MLVTARTPRDGGWATASAGVVAASSRGDNSSKKRSEGISPRGSRIRGSPTTRVTLRGGDLRSDGSEACSTRLVVSPAGAVGDM